LQQSKEYILQLRDKEIQAEREQKEKERKAREDNQRLAEFLKG